MAPEPNTPASSNSMEQQFRAMQERMRQMEEENAQNRATNQELTTRLNGLLTNGGQPNLNNVPETNRLLMNELQELKRGMAQEAKNFKAVIRTIPGVPPPFERSSADTHVLSPFVDRIARVEMPKRSILPNFQKFRGDNDPAEHIAEYRQEMSMVNLPDETREAITCKTFGSSLGGPALTWFLNLPNRSISSFSQLVDTFIVKFSSRRRFKLTTDHLFSVKKRENESLRDYVTRFTNEHIKIPDVVESTAAIAFRNGLPPFSRLYEHLVECEPRTLEEALAIATRQIKLEEDPVRAAATKAAGRPSGKFEQRGNKNRKGRFEPYKRHDPRPHGSSPGQNGRSGDSTRQKRPVPAYELNIEPQALVAVMKDMGSSVKWPEKMRTPADQRDKNKFCQFHNDHGHRTEDCVALRFEIAALLKKGRLREFLTEKGRQTLEKAEEKQHEAKSVEIPAEAPDVERIIGVIHGGSVVSGMTQSSAKRHARELLSVNETSARPGRTPLVYELTFSNNDMQGLADPHHDALVITLQIANCMLKRVLVDNGSSANIMFLPALREMHLDESLIIRDTTTLTGFSGESKQTVGEIVLPVFAGGVNLVTRFLLIDAVSSYNLIMGRPWIHEMRAVPSSYHQTLRFPTKWGIKEIKGDQRSSRECYQAGFKKPNSA